MGRDPVLMVRIARSVMKSLTMMAMLWKAIRLLQHPDSTIMAGYPPRDGDEILFSVEVRGGGETVTFLM
jgi:hypothetical protein